MNELDNCTVVAGFEAKDVYLEDYSKLVVHFTVYDSEFFAEKDIKNLQKGDFIIIDKNSIKVESINRNEYDYVCINGGYDNARIWLTTVGDGIYFEVQNNERRVYYPVGEVTIPVAQ